MVMVEVSEVVKILLDNICLWNAAELHLILPRSFGLKAFLGLVGLSRFKLSESMICRVERPLVFSFDLFCW